MFKAINFESSTFRSFSIIQDFYFLLEAPRSKFEEVRGHVLGLDVAEDPLAVDGAVLPRRLLQRVHAELHEDPPGEVVGGEDDGTVALGLLAHLESML